MIARNRRKNKHQKLIEDRVNEIEVIVLDWMKRYGHCSKTLAVNGYESPADLATAVYLSMMSSAGGWTRWPVVRRPNGTTAPLAFSTLVSKTAFYLMLGRDTVNEHWYKTHRAVEDPNLPDFPRIHNDTGQERVDLQDLLELGWKNAGLNSREKAIIQGRSKKETLKEMGDRFGVTKERIRQIYNVAIKKLREYYESCTNCAEFIT